MPHNNDRLIPVSLEPSPVIEAYKDGVDPTLIRENLRLTTSERVAKMILALRFAEAVRHSPAVHPTDIERIAELEIIRQEQASKE
jgi:hypothetical protein